VVVVVLVAVVVVMENAFLGWVPAIYRFLWI
jgi:hypothetical protein